MNPSPADRPRALVLGSGGRLGAAAVAAFQAAGWHTLGVQRSSAPAPASSPVVAILQSEVSRVEDIARWAGRADVVVHALNPPYPRWQAEALPALEHGMALARRMGARLLLPGNVYGFGRNLPARLDARTPVPAIGQGQTHKGGLRAAMEDRLRGAALQGELRSTVIRAGDFFGAGRGTWFDLCVVRSLAKGRLAYPGPLELEHAWAWLPDLARGFVQVAEASRRGSLTDFEDLPWPGFSPTGRALLEAVESAAADLGCAPPSGRWRQGAFPWWFIRSTGWAWPTGRELAEMAYLWQRPHRLEGEAWITRIGPLPATPLNEAVRLSLLELGFGRRPSGTPVLSA